MADYIYKHQYLNVPDCNIQPPNIRARTTEVILVQYCLTAVCTQSTEIWLARTRLRNGCVAISSAMRAAICR